MANVNELKTKIEPFVRGWLEKKYKIKFEDREIELDLNTGGKHRFDAVSKDRSIIAGIKSSAVREPGNKIKVGPGVIKAHYAEILFLSLIKAKTKLLILTNKEFYNFFVHHSKGRVPSDIELIYCPLTRHLNKRSEIINKVSRQEIVKRKI